MSTRWTAARTRNRGSPTRNRYGPGVEEPGQPAAVARTTVTRTPVARAPVAWTLVAGPTYPRFRRRPNSLLPVWSASLRCRRPSVRPFCRRSMCTRRAGCRFLRDPTPPEQNAAHPLGAAVSGVRHGRSRSVRQIDRRGPSLARACARSHAYGTSKKRAVCPTSPLAYAMFRRRLRRRRQFGSSRRESERFTDGVSGGGILRCAVRADLGGRGVVCVRCARSVHVVRPRRASCVVCRGGAVRPLRTRARVCGKARRNMATARDWIGGGGGARSIVHETPPPPARA